jgi:hypothetical protein
MKLLLASPEAEAVRLRETKPTKGAVWESMISSILT